MDDRWLSPFSANQIQISAQQPGGTIITNAARQLYISVTIVPRTGPSTGPNTAPTPQITIAVEWRCRGNVASRIAWPMGMIGAPNSPWHTRYRISDSRLSAIAHRNDDTVNPSTVQNIRVRQPKREESQWVIGVATAVAARFSVMSQEISSWVTDSEPRICGNTTLASVIVMPNSRFASCTVIRISQWRPLMLKMPPWGTARLGNGAASDAVLVVSLMVPGRLSA